MPYPVKGERRGGRKKGTPNKATLARQAAIDAGITGADSMKFFVAMLADVNQPIELRMSAARELLPYQYAKKPSTEVQVRKSLDDFLTELDEHDRREGQGAPNGSAVLRPPLPTDQD